MKANDVTTGVARLSYAHLFQPYAYQQGQDAKYSTTILVPKTDMAAKQRIDAAIQAAVQAGISEKWGGQKPPILAIPVYDGDGVRPSDGMPFGAECKGHWVFTASSKQPISVVDQSIQPILDQTQVYSGMYARVSVTFFPYNSNGKKGVGCGLNAVQKVSDGEPLGGGVSADEAFGGANGYTGQAAAAPQYGTSQPAAPAYAQPAQTYAPAPASGYPAQGYPQPVAPVYQQPAAPAIDPVTGMPVAPGGVMGL